MGMFDDITGTLPCQHCGQDVSGFQSKDGPCVLASLTPEQLFEEAGSGARFYTSCRACGYWNEWTFAPPTEVRIVPTERQAEQ